MASLIDNGMQVCNCNEKQVDFGGNILAPLRQALRVASAHDASSSLVGMLNCMPTRQDERLSSRPARLPVCRAQSGARPAQPAGVLAVRKKILVPVHMHDSLRITSNLGLASQDAEFVCLGPLPSFCALSSSLHASMSCLAQKKSCLLSSKGKSRVGC